MCVRVEVVCVCVRVCVFGGVHVCGGGEMHTKHIRYLTKFVLCMSQTIYTNIAMTRVEFDDIRCFSNALNRSKW